MLDDRLTEAHEVLNLVGRTEVWLLDEHFARRGDTVL